MHVYRVNQDGKQFTHQEAKYLTGSAFSLLTDALLEYIKELATECFNVWWEDKYVHEKQVDTKRIYLSLNLAVTCT